MNIQKPIMIKDYSYISKIGQGVYSNVYKYMKDDTKIVAIKKYNNENKFRKSIKNELEILKELKNKKENNIIDFYENFELEGYSYSVLEYLNYNLYYFITLKIRDFDFTIKVLKKILKGLDYIHKNNIIHCDLKPENILYDDINDQLRIIDFGNSMKNQEKKTEFYIQSRYYRAPEVLFQLDYNNKIDIWSFGCIAFELLLSKPLYNSKNEISLISMICNDLGIPEIDYYKMSSKFYNYFRLNKNKLELISPNYIGINTDIKGLETFLNINLSRKYKFVNFNQRNKFIDMILSIIKYEYNERPTCEELLKLELFRNIN